MTTEAHFAGARRLAGLGVQCGGLVDLVDTVIPSAAPQGMLAACVARGVAISAGVSAPIANGSRVTSRQIMDGIDNPSLAGVVCIP